jgi:manganese transport protein
VNTTALEALASAGKRRYGSEYSALSRAYRSIRVPPLASGVSPAQRLCAFAGPGFLVAVGYMDPGNWATSLQGGYEFGYSMLFVIFVANALAMLLQAAAVRLGLASGLDLAQACRRHLPPSLNLILWAGCEFAIIACNLAEVLGMAIGLNLLLKIPLSAGVCLTAADAMLILALERRGFRRLEAFIGGLIALISVCFALQLWWLHPAVAEVARGFLPSYELFSNGRMLYVAVGIVGATVMPHNLYLHSAVVQTRDHENDEAGCRHAIRFATLDSNLALGLALLVNAAILVLAAGAFHGASAPVTGLSGAYRLLSPVLGVGMASAVFGIGLIASGLSSSVTGTLAGQVVMEGFLRIRLPAASRALLTRCLAIIPAVIVAASFGSRGTQALLILSQVVLSLQLPFAIVPLLWFTTRRRYLGALAFGRPAAAALWMAAIVIIALNVWMLQSLWTL